MPVETITNFSTLMKYAYELGRARLSKDERRIEEAEKAHDTYRDLCLKSDRMIIPTKN